MFRERDDIEVRGRNAFAQRNSGRWIISLFTGRETKLTPPMTLRAAVTNEPFCLIAYGYCTAPVAHTVIRRAYGLILIICYNSKIFMKMGRFYRFIVCFVIYEYIWFGVNKQNLINFKQYISILKMKQHADFTMESRIRIYRHSDNRIILIYYVLGTGYHSLCLMVFLFWNSKLTLFFISLQIYQISYNNLSIISKWAHGVKRLSVSPLITFFSNLLR